MGMGAHRAMQVAERLYIQVLYPTHAPSQPRIRPGTPEGHTKGAAGPPGPGRRVEEAAGSMTKPRGGKDEGSPPITRPCVRRQKVCWVGRRGGCTTSSRGMHRVRVSRLRYVSRRATLVAGGERLQLRG